MDGSAVVVSEVVEELSVVLPFLFILALFGILFFAFLLFCFHHRNVFLFCF